MRDFVIAADSDSEIPYWFADENDVPVFLMPYTCLLYTSRCV